MTTEILVPSIGYGLTALAPYVLQSCVLAPPPPAPAPQPEEAIFTPVPPGIEYESLPVLDPVTQIIDTSPSQIIGCANALPDGGEQGTLNALFPGAVDGDGVVNRQNNDIWKYDGTTWENVGPTPGPQVVVVSVLPPWNEIAIYDATVRTRLQVVALDYALALLTEPDPIGVLLGVDTLSIRSVKIPTTGAYDIEAIAPTFSNLFTAVVASAPVLYTGTGSTQQIGGLPWSPSLVWIKRRNSFANHILTDVGIGINRVWRPQSNSPASATTNHVTSLDSNGFTLGVNSEVNTNGGTYVAWTLAPVESAQTNTAGTITTTTRANDFMSLVSYTGSGADNTDIGHGLAGAPELIISKALNATVNGIVGGTIVQAERYLVLGSSNAFATFNATYKSFGSTTYRLGTSSLVNQSGQEFIAYAFRSVPGLCKVGSYVGDGDFDGQFVDAGLDIDFLIVKAYSGGGQWIMIDKARNDPTKGITITTQAEFNTLPFYEFASKGFIAKRGSQFPDDDINISGRTYIYIAFGGFRPTVVPELAELELAALPPSV
jgi:hypothetical protein